MSNRQDQADLQEGFWDSPLYLPPFQRESGLASHHHDHPLLRESRDYPWDRSLYRLLQWDDLSLEVLYNQFDYHSGSGHSAVNLGVVCHYA